jgi:hypothetical protein
LGDVPLIPDQDQDDEDCRKNGVTFHASSDVQGISRDGVKPTGVVRMAAQHTAQRQPEPSAEAVPIESLQGVL